MARIDLENVGLTFRVRPFGRPTVKGFVLRKLFRRSDNATMKVRALQDIHLHVRDGDRLGILGHNGAGKSTLLKLLAGIYPPTRGTRRVEGRICSLFDIALGFELDATGWENIAYRGYLQGETPSSVAAKTRAIAEFSELGSFLNMQVRYFSAGMLVRLAFSIATTIEPEILLIDEVLSVGDLAFQEKARQRMHETVAKARLIVLVSHDLDTLSRLCDRAVWMEHGRIHQIGPVDSIVQAYRAQVQANSCPTAGGLATAAAA